MSESPETPELDDPDVPMPAVRPRVVLALLRVLAGPRGWSAVSWSGAGFGYTLRAERRPPGPLHIEWDANGPGVDEARHRLRDALLP